MYILRQPEQFRDTLKLVDKDGREQLVEISLKITPDMIKSYRQLQVKLHDLQNDSRAAEDKAEDMGRAVYALLSLLFGEENTDAILRFYEGDYTSLALDIFPYISDTIAPALQADVQRRKAQYKRRAR